MDGPGLIFFSPRKTNQTNFDEKEKKKEPKSNNISSTHVTSILSLSFGVFLGKSK
jgi:hypothetical protein